VHPQDLSLRDDLGVLVVRDRVGRYELLGEVCETRSFWGSSHHAVVDQHELSAGFVFELRGGRHARLHRRDLAHAAQPSVPPNSLNVDHPPSCSAPDEWRHFRLRTLIGGLAEQV
jgi:hypothetical protein